MALLQISEPGQAPDPHRRRIAVGIDLGTTHSLVAAVRHGVAECLPDAQGRVLLPQKLRARFLQDAKDVEVSGAGTHIRVMRNEDAQSEEEAFEAEIPDVLAFEAEIAARKNN